MAHQAAQTAYAILQQRASGEEKGDIASIMVRLEALVNANPANKDAVIAETRGLVRYVVDIAPGQESILEGVRVLARSIEDSLDKAHATPKVFLEDVEPAKDPNTMSKADFLKYLQTLDAGPHADAAKAQAINSRVTHQTQQFKQELAGVADPQEAQQLYTANQEQRKQELSEYLEHVVAQAEKKKVCDHYAIEQIPLLSVLLDKIPHDNHPSEVKSFLGGMKGLYKVGMNADDVLAEQLLSQALQGNLPFSQKETFSGDRHLDVIQGILDRGPRQGVDLTVESLEVALGMAR